MKIILQMRRRLAEVIGIFPIARHLANQKHEVLIECDAEFRTALNLIDYAKWKDPAEPIFREEPIKIPARLTSERERLENMLLATPIGNEKKCEEIGARMKEIADLIAAIKPTKTQLFDLVYPLQIWPARAHEYRIEKPPQRWLDFVVAPFGDDFRKLRREVEFSRIPELEAVRRKYRLPEKFSIACAAGFPSSQTFPVSFDLFELWLFAIARRDLPVYYLVPKEWRPNRNFICVDDLAEIATLIRHAEEFFTVNSAPAVIAAARLDKKPLRDSWHHVSPRQPQERFQDDTFHPNQVRWEVVSTGSGDHIARQINGRQ